MVSAFEQRRYARPPRPLHFPVEVQVPESKRHLELRTALYQILRLAFGERACIGCDQFVYWDPTDPSACLAPDAFVRIGSKDELFDSWKVWERGAPHVAVEIVSPFDAGPADWDEKLEKYRKLGVVELVRFDPEASQRPLRVWDDVGGDLVERELADPRSAECGPLGHPWVVVEDPRIGPSLRLLDRPGGELLPTSAETAVTEAAARARETEARVRETEARLRETEARARAEVERDSALERVRALEQELARRSRPGGA